MTNDEIMAQINANRPPCAHSLGDGTLVALSEDRSRVVMEFTSTEQHCHSGNIVQGGFVAGMLDNAMSLAVICTSEWQFNPASLEIKVTYLKPVQPGVNKVTGWIVQMGKTIAFLEGEIRNEKGVLLATASSSARLIPFSGVKPG